MWRACGFWLMYVLFFLGCTGPTTMPKPDGGNDAGGPEQPSGPKTGEFSVLTYNVHGLPPSITKDQTYERLKAIAPLLNAFPIVGAQEVFTQEGYDTLLKSNQHETHGWFTEKLEKRAYGSGLLFFSNFSVTSKKEKLFGHCYGLLDGASDCLASKGFQMVRLTIAEGIEVDVYNSHFEAGNGEKDKEARQKNLLELRKAMLSWSKGRAIVFLGDTNLHENRSGDKEALADWIQELALSDACEAVNCPEKGRIDRIFFRSGDAVSLRVTKWWVPETFVDEKGGPLSDHDPIAAQLKWERLAQ